MKTNNTVSHLIWRQMVRNCVSSKEICRALKIQNRTFIKKMETGDFTIKEFLTLSEMLKIKILAETPYQVVETRSGEQLYFKKEQIPLTIES